MAHLGGVRRHEGDLEGVQQGLDGAPDVAHQHVVHLARRGGGQEEGRGGWVSEGVARGRGLTWTR